MTSIRVLFYFKWISLSLIIAIAVYCDETESNEGLKFHLCAMLLHIGMLLTVSYTSSVILLKSAQY